MVTISGNLRFAKRSEKLANILCSWSSSPLHYSEVLSNLETAAVVTAINYTPPIEEKHNLQDCILPAERAAVDYTWNKGKRLTQFQGRSTSIFS